MVDVDCTTDDYQQRQRDFTAAGSRDRSRSFVESIVVVFHVHLLVFLLVFAVVMGSFAPAAQAADVVPLDVQVPLLLRVLSADTELTKRAPDALVVLVVITSPKVGQAAVSRFKEFENRSIQAMPLRVFGMPIEALAQTMSVANVQAVYLPDGLDAATVERALALCEKKRVPMLAGNSEFTKQGAALGLSLENDKPKIIVNVANATKQGMALDKSIMSVARTIP